MILLLLFPAALSLLSPFVWLGWRQGTQRLSRARTAFATATLVLLSLTPYALLLVICLTAERAETLLGHPLRYMLDDPTYIGRNDPLYQRLGDLVDIGIELVSSSFPGWVSTALLLRKSLPLWARWMVGTVYVLGCLTVMMNGSSEWWMGPD